ncbi:MAG: M23 family metallopeptidase [candidate division WOR-3 bacterium]
MTYLSLKKILYLLVIIFLSLTCSKIKSNQHRTGTNAINIYTKDFSPQLGEAVLPFFRRCQIPETLAIRIIRLFKEFDFNFTRIKPSDVLRVFVRNDSIKTIEYHQDPTRIYCFEVLPNGGLKISMLYRPVNKKLCIVKGIIHSSLYESMLNIGENPSLILNFADILSWEIDFFTETQNGDSFFVLVEKKYCNEQFIGYGQIYAVRYKGQIGDVAGFYFCDSNGYKDFYNHTGKSLRKALLKSPLRYSYISSYYSRSRFHPILKVVRPHRGIDYVAPEGTPVSAIGDGIISFAGWKGGYGRLVEIKHPQGFTSRYGHLRSFSKGIRAGMHITQGQVIGYVGSTGLATGPHLHFELLQNGKWVNPLKVIIPRADPVKSQYFNTFVKVRDSFQKLLYH